MSPAQIQRAEAEKQALLEAVKPIPKAPRAEAQDGLNQRRLPTITIKPVAPKPDPVVAPAVLKKIAEDATASVQDALDAQAAAAQALEDAKQELEAADLRVAETQQAAAVSRSEEGRAANARSLEQAITALGKQRERVLAVHRVYDATLKRMAQSCASGDSSRERERIQQLYTEAGLLRHQLGLAFKAVEAAEKTVTGALSSPESWIAEQAAKSIADALKFNVSEIADRVEQIIRESGILGKREYVPKMPELAHEQPTTEWSSDSVLNDERK